jgi:hypothetical protein
MEMEMEMVFNGKLINPWLAVKLYPSANRVMPVKVWGYQSVVSGGRCQDDQSDCVDTSGLTNGTTSEPSVQDRGTLKYLGR